MAKTKAIAEYGDFQTPLELARQVCSLLNRRRVAPATIIEPTCGKGTFLQAAVETFPSTSHLIGLDINSHYLEEARKTLPAKATLITGDFFATDWAALLRGNPEPLLILGNPPWVTNAELGSLNSGNLPKKSNFQNYRGLDAITGKSNFDISEWMLIKLIEWLSGRRATIAMLCKTAVARKVLAHSWKHKTRISAAEIYPIDALKHFGAAVDACLLFCDLRNESPTYDCAVYSSLDASKPIAIHGYRDQRLFADVSAFDQLRHLEGESPYRWRSGIKHDCSKVMELTRDGQLYRNGLNESVELEQTYLYPMLKSSALANGHVKKPKRWMLVTQRSVGDETCFIKDHAPRTWEYLMAHDQQLGKRGSIIYKNRPPFSVFGVGDYTFAPWKVAISGFYKSLAFTVVGSHAGKPIVLDDTAYFIACQTEAEATYLASLLNSNTAKTFYSAYVFWDTKRPITVAILARLNLFALARQLGSEDEFLRYAGNRLIPSLF